VNTITPQDGPTRNIESKSPEDRLRWALAHGTFDDLKTELSKNPDPFFVGQRSFFSTLNELEFDEKSLELTDQKVQSWIEYSDKYLIKLIQNTEHTPTKAHAEIVRYTPLPTVLAPIITDYMNSFTYQFKHEVMQYIQARTRDKLHGYFDDYPRTFPSWYTETLSPILPRCTDTQGDNLVDYFIDENLDPVISEYVSNLNTKKYMEQLVVDENLDPFITRNARKIFEHYHDHSIIFEMIKVHVHNLLQDQVLFASPIELTLFNTTLQGCNRSFEKDYFKHSDQYKLIQNYIKAAPHLLSMHYENKSIFDHIDAACNANTIQFEQVNERLGLILEHKIAPNMQDGKTGNTFLHRVALDQERFTLNRCPDESPFIKQCAPQLDLTIANNDRQTVFDIVESQIKYCNEHKLIDAHDSYQKFMQKLLAIKVFATTPPSASTLS